MELARYPFLIDSQIDLRCPKCNLKIDKLEIVEERPGSFPLAMHWESSCGCEISNNLQVMKIVNEDHKVVGMDWYDIEDNEI